MCGIIGYLGSKPAADVVLKGLKALEYRGYDSAGIALIEENSKVDVIKQAGRVDNLIPLLRDVKPTSHIAIGHTRWATHGLPNSKNAHPHANNDNSIFVVHNGIIENYTELKEQLSKHGYVFYSDTDTEVIPNLIDYYAKKSVDFETAVKDALNDLSGAFAIAVLSSHQPDTIYAARVSSPLVIGVGKDDEYILASDPNAIMEYTKEVIFLNDNEMAVIKKGHLTITDFKASVTHDPKIELLDYDQEKSSLGDFPNFMLYPVALQVLQVVCGRTCALLLRDKEQLG